MFRRLEHPEEEPRSQWMERGEVVFEIPEEYRMARPIAKQGDLGARPGTSTSTASPSVGLNINRKWDHEAVARLPPEVLERIVDYLPAPDALLACRSSPLWNENISALNAAWRRKFLRLNMFSPEYQPVRPWKEECERAVAMAVKISTQAVVKNSTKFYVKMDRVTAVDYCNEIMVCCGPPVGDSLGRVGLVNIYRRRKQTWDLLRSCRLSPESIGAVNMNCCVLLDGLKLVMGCSDGVLLSWQIEIPERVAQESDITIYSDCAQAHPENVFGVSVDKDLGIVASCGDDEIIRLWNLDDLALLATITFQLPDRFTKVLLCLLSGEKSPFVGYNCLLFQKTGEGGTVGMACWGQGIPITQALVSLDICHTAPYMDPGFPLRRFFPRAFVEGGSVVYAFRSCNAQGYSDRDKKQKLIWQPIEADDFIKVGTNIDNGELRKFRESQHPRKERRSLDLYRPFLEIVGVGRCFTIGFLFQEREIMIIRNSTGDADKLFLTENRSGFMDSWCELHPTKIFSTKWLDGFDHIEPNSIIMMRPPSLSRVVYYWWKRDAAAFEAPTVTQLCDFMRKKRSLLSPWYAMRPKPDQYGLIRYGDYEDFCLVDDRFY